MSALRPIRLIPQESRGAASPDHVVHFWDQEAALHEAVAAYLAEGLADAGTGLFIGQPDHWSGVARLLGTRGFDIPALIRPRAPGRQGRASRIAAGPC